MKYLTIVLVGIFLTSCMTVKRIERNCELFETVCVTKTETNTETTTETNTETTYGDTTATVHIPGKKVKDKIPVKIEDENKKPVPVKKKYVNSELSVLTVPYAKSFAQVINSRLEHKLTQTDTILLFKLKNALKTVKRQEKIIKVLSEKYVVTVTENSNWAKLCIKVVWALIVVVILGVVYLIFKNRIKLLGLLNKNFVDLS